MLDRSRRLTLVLFAAAALVRAQPAYDLMLKGGHVIDPKNGISAVRDVAIKDGRIARIGRVAPSEAAQTIDAKGQILAPGFIDVHTHVESIYNQPTADNFVRMGVTSLVTGNGKVSTSSG